MELILLHGEDFLKSYEILQKFIEVAKARGLSVEKIYKKGSSISQILSSNSLFSKESFFVLEDITLLNKKEGEWLKKNIGKLKGNLVIYHPGQVPKSFLKTIPKVKKEEEFKLPKLIWSFLETFYPGNVKNCLQILHKLNKKEPIEFVFALLGSHLRDLYWVKVDAKAVPYPAWRVGKLGHQAGKFKKQQLSEIINDLASADIKSKTSEGNLIDLLDFIIATKLE